MKIKNDNQLNDIVCMQENTQGNDYIIGDVHGNKACFNIILASLKPQDRLFIVGDLADRGPGSAAVINCVVDNRNRIFCVRGNHEDEYLSAIANLEKLAMTGSYLFQCEIFQAFMIEGITVDIKSLIRTMDDEDQNTFTDLYERLEFDLLNHRGWLVKLFYLEFITTTIFTQEGFYKPVEYSDKSLIKKFSDFIGSLPFIIHVSGKNPFNIVHADLPVTNSELLKRISEKNMQLSKMEKKYAMWRRGTQIDPFIDKNNTDEIITYVGHNILLTQTTSLPIVRLSTHTVNLDIATYFYNISLVVNHSCGTTQFLGKGKIFPQLAEKKQELDVYLNKRLHIDNQSQVKECTQDQNQPKAQKRQREHIDGFFREEKRPRIDNKPQLEASVNMNQEADAVVTDEELATKNRPAPPF